MKEVGFSNLNLIRALSGMVVVFSHFLSLFVIPVYERNPAINWSIASAEYAVLTFFALSGFLIALSIQRNVQKYGYFDWKEYIVSRVARIYPALIASVLLCVLLYFVLKLLHLGGPGSIPRLSDVNPVSRTEFSISGMEVLFTLLQTYAFGPGGYINVNGPLWSLSYEVGFYLKAGLFMVIIGRNGISRIFALICLGILAFIAIKFNKILYLHYGTVWILGVGLFFVLKGSKYYRNIVLLFIGLGLINFVIALSGFAAIILINFVASIFIILVLFFCSRYQKNIQNGMAKMADSTYTLYLFHFPIMLFFYVIIRDFFEISHTLYFGCATLLTLLLIPFCHYLAKVLENRKMWELFLTRCIHNFI